MLVVEGATSLRGNTRVASDLRQLAAAKRRQAQRTKAREDAVERNAVYNETLRSSVVINEACERIALRQGHLDEVRHERAVAAHEAVARRRIADAAARARREEQLVVQAQRRKKLIAVADERQKRSMLRDSERLAEECRRRAQLRRRQEHAARVRCRSEAQLRHRANQEAVRRREEAALADLQAQLLEKDEAAQARLQDRERRLLEDLDAKAVAEDARAEEVRLDREALGRAREAVALRAWRQGEAKAAEQVDALRRRQHGEVLQRCAQNEAKFEAWRERSAVLQELDEVDLQRLIRDSAEKEQVHEDLLRALQSGLHEELVKHRQCREALQVRASLKRESEMLEGCMLRAAEEEMVSRAFLAMNLDYEEEALAGLRGEMDSLEHNSRTSAERLSALDWLASSGVQTLEDIYSAGGLKKGTSSPLLSTAFPSANSSRTASDFSESTTPVTSPPTSCLSATHTMAAC